MKTETARIVALSAEVEIHRYRDDSTSLSQGIVRANADKEGK